MQGETRVGLAGASRSRGWLASAIVAVALAGGLLPGVGMAQGLLGMPPVVTLSASTTQIAANTTTVLTAVATDADGTVASVKFYNGAALVSTATQAPYRLNFTPTAAGSYTMKAVATDNQGKTATSNAVVITVLGGGNPPPVVSLSASPPVVTLGQSTVLTSVATDDGSIARVTFYSNGAVISTDTSAPYQFTYQPPAAGTYMITAVAVDNESASTTSVGIMLTVSGGGGGGGGGGALFNTAPTVSLTASPATVQVNTATLLSANASDSDGTIARVDFYNGAALISSDTTSPYSVNFTPTTVATHSVTARAYDNKGAMTVSSPVSVVAQAAPTVSTPPRITMSLSNSLFTPGSVVTINGSATATMPGATVARVSFFMNGTRLVDDTVSPYSTTATLPADGNYDIYAEVADSLGQVATTLIQRAVVKSPTAVVTTDADVWRLLNQATFGASQAEAARVNSLGIAGWINDQMAKPISGYPDSKYNRIQLSTTADCTTNMPEEATTRPTRRRRCAHVTI